MMIEPLFVLGLFGVLYAASIRAIMVTDQAVIVERKLGTHVYQLNEIVVTC